MPVLLALSEQPLRYNRLLERLPGVSRRMLTLTPAGEELIGVVEALERWADRVSAGVGPPAG